MKKKSIALFISLLMVVQLLYPVQLIKAQEGTATVDLLANNAVNATHLEAFKTFILKASSGKIVCEIWLDDDFLTTCAESGNYPEVSAQFIMDGTYLEIPEGEEDADIKDRSGTVVAKLHMEKAGEEIISKITYTDAIKGSESVNVSAELGVQLIEDNDTKEVSGYIWDDIEKKIKLQVSSKPGTTPETPVYEVVKSALSKVRVPKLDYTIAVKCTNDTLAEKVLKDTIPDGLRVKKVTLDGKIVPPSYDTDGKTLLVQIPSSISNPNEVEIVVSCEYRAGGEIDITKVSDNTVKSIFSNKAQLTDKENKTVLTTSKRIDTEMSFARITKKELLMTDNQVKWGIDLNGNYQEVAENTYLIDYVNSSIHTYDAAKALTVSADGASSVTLPMTKTTSDTTGADSPSNLTPSRCKTMTGGNNIVYYTSVDSTTNNEIQVMIVPYQVVMQQLSARGGDLSKVTFEYYTTRTGKVKEGAVEKISNTAKLIWHVSGAGIGVDGDYSSAEVKKTLEQTLLNKSNKGWTLDTQTASWSVDVNPNRLNLKDVKVIETFDNGRKNKVIFDRAGGEVIKAAYYQYNADGTRPSVPTKIINFVLDKDGTFEKYEYQVTERADGSTESLVLNFGDITEDDYYCVEIYTKLIDGNYFNKYSARDGISASNTVKYTFSGMLPEEDTSITETATLYNKPMLLKDAVGSYDYCNHTLEWKATVNPHYLPIADAVLTDKLPDGSVLKKVKSVTRNSREGIVSTGTITDFGEKGTIKFADGLVITYETTEDAKVNFVFSNLIQDQFTFDFETAFTDDYRLNSLVNQEGEVPVHNEVNLNGNIYGVELSEIEADATHKVNTSILEKSGRFDETNGNIDWSILLNRDGCDLTGMYAVDDVSKIKNLSLLEDSIGLYKVSLNADGTIKTMSDITESYWNKELEIQDGKIIFKFPENLKHEVLKLSFSMHVTGDVNAADVVNTVTLYDKLDNKLTDSTIKPEDMVDIVYSKYAEKHKMLILNIKKTSAESGSALSGATYEITPMKKAGKTWIKNDDLTSYTRITKADGTIRIAGLKRDTLYEIKEIDAPAGYVLDETPFYLVFCSESGITSGYPNGTKIIKETETALDFVNELEIVKTSETPETSKVPVTSEAPATSEVPATSETPGTSKVPVTSEVPATSGTPVTSEGPMISESPVKSEGPLVSFIPKKACITIKNDSEDGKKKGFTFRITGTFERNMIFQNDFVTDANGLIIIDKLPEGTYTIRELGTEISKKYILPESQVIALLGADTTVEFYNKLKPETPKPSEEGKGQNNKTDKKGDNDKQQNDRTDKKGDNKKKQDKKGNGEKKAEADKKKNYPQDKSSYADSRWNTPENPIYTTGENNGSDGITSLERNNANGVSVPKTGDHSISIIWLYIFMILSGITALWSGISFLVAKFHKRH